MDRRHSVGGIFILDKATARSSAGAADDVRKELARRGLALRCGHGGTLDPFATGVLAVCLGEGTKIAPYLLADDKAYEADVVLGVETDTLDRTGKVIETSDAIVTEEQLRAAARARLGEQDQIPPMHSAIKQGGVRLYQLARRGEEVERAARRVRIDRLEVLAFDGTTARLAIACSKGTYIRSLVADLARDVGSVGHLRELRRTRSGKLAIEDAWHIDQVRDATLEAIIARFVPLAGLSGLPSFEVPLDLYDHVRNGVQLQADRFGAFDVDKFQLVDAGGALRAIVHVDPIDRHVIYDRVFLA